MRKILILFGLSIGLVYGNVLAETNADEAIMLSIDDIDLGDIESIEQIPSSVLKDHEENLPWGTKLRIAYKGAKFAISEHIKNNQMAYILGTVCGGIVIAGGLAWYFKKNTHTT